MMIRAPSANPEIRETRVRFSHYIQSRWLLVQLHRLWSAERESNNETGFLQRTWPTVVAGSTGFMMNSLHTVRRERERSDQKEGKQTDIHKKEHSNSAGNLQHPLSGSRHEIRTQESSKDESFRWSCSSLK